MREIILASQSPRRKEIMELAGYDFQVIISNEPEYITKENPSEVVLELSLQKAKNVWNKLLKEGIDCSNKVVVGADTVVSIDQKILGKPKDEEEAFAMLSNLSGRTHEVYTGVSLVWMEDNTLKENSFYECTEVMFYPMSEDEIWTYIKTKDAMDKAGAYGIQSKAAPYIKGINGDYYNVVGLPIARLYQELSKL